LAYVEARAKRALAYPKQEQKRKRIPFGNDKLEGNGKRLYDRYPTAGTL
jgi:hypothetical protein